MSSATEVSSGHGGKAADKILTFLSACSSELTARAATTEGPSAPQISEGAATFAEALQQSTALDFEPSWLQALDTIHTAGAVDDTELARSFAELAPMLRWVPTRRASDQGADFGLAPLESVRDFGTLTVGLMYVRPGAQYPLHQHPPQELYLTLSGQAQWRFGGNDTFQPLGPYSTIYNHPDDLHSAIAGDTPLVALYVLWPS